MATTDQNFALSIESFQFIDSRGSQSSTPPQEAAATAPPSDDVPF